MRSRAAAVALPGRLLETRDDRAFGWLLVFTLVLFLRPQDLFPPLEVLHLAEISAIAGLLSLGFYPQPVLDTFTPAMSTLQQHVQASTAALGGAR